MDSTEVKRRLVDQEYREQNEHEEVQNEMQDANDQEGAPMDNGDPLPRTNQNREFSIKTAMFAMFVVVIGSFLISSWSKVAFETKVTFIVLISVACLGTLTLIALYRDVCKNTQQIDWENIQDRPEDVNHYNFLERIFVLNHDRSDKGSTIWKIKHGFLFTFAVGYLTHCGWYLARGILCKDSDSTLRIAYNIISIVFTFLQLLFFVIHKNMKFEFTSWSKHFVFGVIIQNVFIWLDAMLSESAGLFDKNITIKHENVSNCSIHGVINFIDNADTFLTPMMIEYSLLAIQLLWSISRGGYQRQITLRNGREEVELRIIKEMCCSIFISTLSLIFFCFTAAFFMFTLYVTFRENGDSMALFGIFIWFQIANKTCMLLFILIILLNIVYIKRKDTKFHPCDVGKFSLVFSGCGNIINCMFDLFPVINLNDQSEKLLFAHSIICIFLQFVQTVVLFMVPEKYSRCMQCLYPQLAILNFGLWACGSIGEIRVHTFSEIQYHYYGKTMWIINTKLFLSVSIFYRYHCAMEFLELWVESSTFS